MAKDSTLISVVMLCFFEKITYEGNGSALLSRDRIEGACALMQLRAERKVKGYEDFDVVLVKHFYSVVLTMALGAGLPVPSSIRDVWDWSTKAEHKVKKGGRARMWDHELDYFVNATHVSRTYPSQTYCGYKLMNILGAIGQVRLRRRQHLCPDQGNRESTKDRS